MGQMMSTPGRGWDRGLTNLADHVIKLHLRSVTDHFFQNDEFLHPPGPGVKRVSPRFPGISRAMAGNLHKNVRDATSGHEGSWGYWASHWSEACWDRLWLAETDVSDHQGLCSWEHDIGWREKLQTLTSWPDLTGHWSWEDCPAFLRHDFVTLRDGDCDGLSARHSPPVYVEAIPNL